MTAPVPLTRAQVLRGNRRWFEGVSLVVISNTLWVGERVPCLTYGMRGMISLSIEVRSDVCFHPLSPQRHFLVSLHVVQAPLQIGVGCHKQLWYA